MLFAAIDIGSNAVRLYFANVYEKNKHIAIEKASLIRIPLRLGEDVFNTGYISETKKQELLQTLTAFKMLIDVYKPLSYCACATAAMREAANRNEIVSEIKNTTGVSVQVIDGLEEARIIGATEILDDDKKYEYTLYIDVGGGSTEISIVRNETFIDSGSFRIGTIRMLYGKDEPSEWERMKTWLEKHLYISKELICVGSGGNINKLAKIYGNYEQRLLSYKNLEKGYYEIAHTPLNDRIEKMGMRPDRADVIEPAAKIFMQIMKNIQAQIIYVPKIGLADGIIHEVYKSHILNLNNCTIGYKPIV